MWTPYDNMWTPHDKYLKISIVFKIELDSKRQHVDTTRQSIQKISIVFKIELDSKRQIIKFPLYSLKMVQPKVRLVS